MVISNPEDDLVPWVEKYRPKTLEEVASQTYTIESLKKFVERGTLPHMIFTGPAGTGKTSAAMSLINDLMEGEILTQDVILERNASDECRMQNLPEIKNFVYHTGVNQTKYKFVVLDEADNLSKDVQSAFRRVIEMAPANVKFIFMCNYVENIIGPILSRCAIFRFYPLPKKDFEKQLLKISKNEGIKISDEMIEAIFYISQGDMRKAINLLQIVHAYADSEKSAQGEAPEIDVDTVYQISGHLASNDLKQIFQGVQNLELENTINQVRDIHGISSRALFRQIMGKIIKNREDYPHPKLPKLLEAIAEYDYRLTLEADPRIQIDGFFSHLISVIQEGYNN